MRPPILRNAHTAHAQSQTGYPEGHFLLFCGGREFIMVLIHHNVCVDFQLSRCFSPHTERGYRSTDSAHQIQGLGRDKRGVETVQHKSKRQGKRGQGRTCCMHVVHKHTNKMTRPECANSAAACSTMSTVQCQFNAPRQPNCRPRPMPSALSRPFDGVGTVCRPQASIPQSYRHMLLPVAFIASRQPARLEREDRLSNR